MIMIEIMTAIDWSSKSKGSKGEEEPSRWWWEGGWWWWWWWSSYVLQREGEFSNVLVIQSNDHVVTAMDKAIGVRCSYDVGNITGETLLHLKYVLPCLFTPVHDIINSEPLQLPIPSESYCSDHHQVNALVQIGFSIQKRSSRCLASGLLSLAPKVNGSLSHSPLTLLFLSLSLSHSRFHSLTHALTNTYSFTHTHVDRHTVRMITIEIRPKTVYCSARKVSVFLLSFVGSLTLVGTFS